MNKNAFQYDAYNSLFTVKGGGCLSGRSPEKEHGTRDSRVPLFTGRNEVVAKVMFLLVSVILSTGGGGGFCLKETPLPRRHPAAKETSPWKEAPPCQGDPLGGGTPLPRRPPLEGGPPAYGQ